MNDQQGPMSEAEWEKEKATKDVTGPEKGGIQVTLSQEELVSIITLLGQLPTESGAYPLYDYLCLYLPN